MKKSLNILCGILLVAIAFSGNAQASQLKCEPFFTTYSVNVLCFIRCSHHNGKNGLLKKYSETDLGPIRGGYSDAYDVGKQAIFSEAYVRLLQECKDFSCDCENSGCPCQACTPPPPEQSSQVSEEIKGVKIIQETKPRTSILNPAVLKKVKNINGITVAQKEYIDKHYEGYAECANMYTIHDGRYIHIVLIGKEGSPSQSVYFDMTNVYKKLERSRDKAEKMKIMELMKDHMPLEIEAEK